jgi:hypothetical protein
MLPMRLPYESPDGRMRAEHIAALRAWPNSANFKAQCDARNLSEWNRNFIADVFDDRLDVIAAHSGYPAIATVRAYTVIDALAAAGQELAAGGLNPATQQRVHRAYQAYADAAAINNPDRQSRQDALCDHAISGLGSRSDIWYAANAARYGRY